MMEITEELQYLGDGVYIYSDGYHLVMQTEPQTKIYLDSQVQLTLYEILKEQLEKEDD